MNTQYEHYCYAKPGSRVCQSLSHTRQRIHYLPQLEVQITDQVAKAARELMVLATINGSQLVLWRKPAAADLYQLRDEVHDHNGSVQLTLDSRGKIIRREKYYPFGGTALWATTSKFHDQGIACGYSGKRRDASLLYHFGFRYYACWLMRWLNADPAETIDGLNLFRMVRNNPISLNDPDGCKPQRAKPSRKAASQAEKALINAPETHITFHDGAAVTHNRSWLFKVAVAIGLGVLALTGLAGLLLLTQPVASNGNSLQQGIGLNSSHDVITAKPFLSANLSTGNLVSEETLMRAEAGPVGLRRFLLDKAEFFVNTYDKTVTRWNNYLTNLYYLGHRDDYHNMLPHYQILFDNLNDAKEIKYDLSVKKNMQIYEQAGKIKPLWNKMHTIRDASARHLKELKRKDQQFRRGMGWS